jgi:hypothetical protein
MNDATGNGFRAAHVRGMLRLTAALTAGILCLASCGGGNSGGASASTPQSVPPVATPPPMTLPPPPVPMASIHGRVNGGHVFIKGASVTLRRVGTSGYGSQSIVLGTATTDSSGGWTVSFPQPSDDPLVYITADGGDLGSGTHSAIALMSALGPLSRVPSDLTVNEVTTVGSVYALAKFLDAGTAMDIGAPASNAIGLATAFGTVPNLIDPRLGAALVSADDFTPILNSVTHASEAPPGSVVNGLANIIAACIGSPGSNSTECTTLFGLVTPPDGHAPTNTREVLLDIALYPANNVSALFDLSTTAGIRFTPDLGGVAPNDWTLAINFTGGALAGSVPTGVAIDAAGNVWITGQRCNPLITSGLGCVYELRSQGSVAGPFPNSPQGIALDFNQGKGGAIAIGKNPNNGQEIVWVAADFTSSLYALDAGDGSFFLGGAITAGGQLKAPLTLATDTLGNVWAMNSRSQFLADGSAVTSLLELSPGSTNDYSVINVFNHSTPAGVTPPTFSAMALDGGAPADIWVSDAIGRRIVDFSGANPGLQSATQSFVPPSPGSPGPIAVDANGNVWSADQSGGATVLLKSATGFTERHFRGNTIYAPGAIAIDGAGNAWVSNTDIAANKGVVEIAPSGLSQSVPTVIGAYTGGSPPGGGPLGITSLGTSPRGIAIDASGNVWVATGEAAGVVELIGAAVPVKTPLHGPAVRP